MKMLLNYLYDEERLAFLREQLGEAWEIEVIDDLGDEDQVLAKLPGTDAMVGMYWKASYPRIDSLKLVQLAGAGFDGVDFNALPNAASVCNVFEHEIGISEYLLLVMLEWKIRLMWLHSNLQQKRWVGTFQVGAPLHGELAGKTVGFVGYGRISSETAKRLKAFDVRTLACTRTPSRSDEYIDEITSMDGLHDVLKRSDFVVVACPLTEDTRGLIDAAALDALGPDGVIINVARGPLIDEDALWEACRDKRIAGAAIDTWYHYPSVGSDICQPSKHPIHELDNVILSPHASGWSEGLLDRRWSFIAQNLKALQNGKPLRNVLRAAGQPPSF